MTALFPHYIFMKGARRMAFLWRKTKRLCAGLVGPGLARSSWPPRQSHVCHRPGCPEPSHGESPPAPNRLSRLPSSPHPCHKQRPPGTGGGAPGSTVACHPPVRTCRGEESFCCHVYMKWHLLDTHCPRQLPPEDQVPAVGTAAFSVCTGWGPASQRSKYSRQINNPHSLPSLHVLVQLHR